MSRRYPVPEHLRTVVPPQYTKITDLARTLHISQDTLNMLADAGKVDAVKVKAWKGPHKGKMQWWINPTDLLRVMGAGK
jgi:hypothetical protein